MNENLVDTIVNNENFSYSYYKKLVGKYLNNDCREITLQHRVVIPLLDTLFINEKDISIIDISRQNNRNNSVIHTTRSYRKKDASSPDLLIARNWNYANIDNEEIEYLAVVELKSPAPKLNPIYNKKNDFSGQIKTHLEANHKVILTDCIKWEFFKKDLVPVKTFNLFDGDKWIKNEGKTPEFLIEEFQFESTYEDEPQEWNQLCEYLREFINSN